jgi:hypothetical protein
MKRRSFLGFLGGAAVAGPSMAKQAVTATLSDMSLSGVTSGAANAMGLVSAGYAAPGASAADYARGELAKWIGRTAAQHAFHMKQTHVHQLDPDILAWRSIALHEKIRVQREREYWRQFNGQKSWFEAQISGWLE